MGFQKELIIMEKTAVPEEQWAIIAPSRGKL